jgi:hypothetical protein
MEVLVKRRIGFAVPAIAAATVVVGAGIATAASKTTAAAVLKCHSSLSTVPPSGSASVDQPPTGGSAYGPLHCSTKGFGSGIESTTFTIPDTGDIVGKYSQFLGDGSVRGTFDLAPAESSGTLTPTSFEGANYAGTLKIKGGTGAFKGIAGLKGKKNLGTMTCTTPDQVHYTCTEKVKLSSI